MKFKIIQSSSLPISHPSSSSEMLSTTLGVQSNIFQTLSSLLIAFFKQSGSDVQRWMYAAEEYILWMLKCGTNIGNS